MTNKIHPTAIIEGDVQLGANNEIGAYSILQGPLKIGDNNLISPHVVIGLTGEDTRNPRHDATNNPIQIGDNNIIREFTSIQKPCYENITKLGNNVFVMHGCHVPHDCVLEDKVTVAPLVCIGGIVKVMQGANLGMKCVIHQKTVVGAYSIVAMGAAATKHVKPFCRYIPGKPLSVNVYALEKYNFIQYLDEITKYVLEDIMPTSAPVLALVIEFQTVCAATDAKRGIY